MASLYDMLSNTGLYEAPPPTQGELVPKQGGGSALATTPAPAITPAPAPATTPAPASDPAPTPTPDPNMAPQAEDSIGTNSLEEFFTERGFNPEPSAAPHPDDLMDPIQPHVDPVERQPYDNQDYLSRFSAVETPEGNIMMIGPDGTYLDPESYARMAGGDEEAQQRGMTVQKALLIGGIAAGITLLTGGTALAALAAAGVSIASDWVITKYVSDPMRDAGHENLALAADIVVGIFTGLTIERAAERVIVGLAQNVTDMIAVKGISKVITPQDHMQIARVSKEAMNRPEAPDIIRNAVKQATYGDVMDEFDWRAFQSAQQKVVASFARPIENVDEAAETLVTKVQKGEALTIDDFDTIEGIAITRAAQAAQKEVNEALSETVTKVADELYDDQPIARAYSEWMEGGAITGSSMVKAGVGHSVVNALSKKFPELIKEYNPKVKASDEQVKSITDLAKRFDYTDVEQFVADMALSANKTQVRSSTLNRMREVLEDQFNNTFVVKKAEMEQQLIEELYGRELKGVVGESIEQLTTSEVARQAKNLARTASDEVQSPLIQRLARRAGKAAPTKGILPGMRVAGRILSNVINAKNLGTGANDILEGVQSIVNSSTMKSLDPNFREHLEALQQMTLKRPQTVVRSTNETFTQFIEAQLDDPLNIGIHALMRNEANAEALELLTNGVRVADMTMEQFRKVVTFFEQASHAGREAARFRSMHKGRSVDSVINEMEIKFDEAYGADRFADDTITGNVDKPSGIMRKTYDTAMNATRRLGANLKRMEPIVRQIDAFEDRGLAWRTIFKPAQDAENARDVLIHRMFTDLQNVMSKYTKAAVSKSVLKKMAPHMAMQKHLDEVVGTFGRGEKRQAVRREMAIMMKLNAGNPQNAKVLLKHFGLDEMDNVQLDKFFSEVLTESDNALAKSIHKMMDDLYPEIDRVYKAITGDTLTKVKGDYFPIVEKASRMGREADIVEAMLAGDARKAKLVMQESFTNPRKGGASSLNLTMDVISRHFSSAAHFITHAETLMDISKVVSSTKFKNMVAVRLGKAIAEQFDPWVKGMARPQYDKHNALLRRLRVGYTTAVLGLQLKTAIKQTLSGITVIPEMGGVHKGTYHMIRTLTNEAGRPGFFSEVSAVSPQMRFRNDQWNRDLRELMEGSRNMSIGKLNVSRRVINSAMMMIAKVDQFTATTVWRSAYRKAVNDGLDDKAAIEMADMIVRKSQPMSTAANMPNWMRSGEGKRALTMFNGAINVIHNQVGEMIQRGIIAKGTSPSKRAELAFNLAWVVMVPGLVIETVGTLYGNIVGSEVDFDMEDATHNMVMQTTSAIPILGPAASHMFLGYTFEVTPALEPIRNLAEGAAEFNKWFNDDKGEVETTGAEKLLTGAGQLLGWPTEAVERFIEAAYADYIGMNNTGLGDYFITRPRDEDDV